MCIDYIKQWTCGHIHSVDHETCSRHRRGDRYCETRDIVTNIPGMCAECQSMSESHRGRNRQQRNYDTTQGSRRTRRASSPTTSGSFWRDLSPTDRTTRNHSPEPRGRRHHRNPLTSSDPGSSRRRNDRSRAPSPQDHNFSSGRRRRSPSPPPFMSRGVPPIRRSRSPSDGWQPSSFRTRSPARHSRRPRHRHHDSDSDGFEEAIGRPSTIDEDLEDFFEEMRLY